MPTAIPTPNNEVSLHALRALIREKNLLAAMQVFSEALGSVFQITLPGFRPVVLVGPEANRFLLVSGRGDLRWRSEGDPVTRLLRHGVLVEDGDSHDDLRRQMNPALHKQMLGGYLEAMTASTDAIVSTWQSGSTYDMLVEMRRVALLILMETLFKVDFSPEMKRLWHAILKTLQYISPGLWILWREIPRPGYAQSLRQLDDYLYQVIAERRKHLGDADDLLGSLIVAGMDDDLIRDQLLTMLIAGHDTSTALLSWALYLLGKHLHVLQQVREEMDTVLGQEKPTLEKLPELRYLGQVIDETLRLYPPIHLGQRVAAVDIPYEQYVIPAGSRVMYSTYLTHRLKAYWEGPNEFQPERFAVAKSSLVPYSYLPFGGGPRNCIGAAFSLVEAKIVLVRLLQAFNITLVKDNVHVHMGATLEPRPGVLMRVQRR